MNTDQIAELFTHHGDYAFARWARPIAPVVFGLDDDTMQVFRTAAQAVIRHAGHPMTDADPEMGANLMMFFVTDWSELDEVPELDQLTGQYGLVGSLRAENADRYRLRRYEQNGAIRATLCFVRVGGALADTHPAMLAEHLCVNAMLNFAQEVTPSAPLAQLIRAAYDPVLPEVATDPAHALRLHARMTAGRALMHGFPVRVYYEDTDLAGIVYYANYLKFIERARSEWLRDLGIDQTVLKARGLVFAVRRIEGDYLAPARFDDLLDVTSTLHELGKARITMCQKVRRGDRLLFSAVVTLVCLDAGGRPVRLPAELAAAMGDVAAGTLTQN